MVKVAESAAIYTILLEVSLYSMLDEREKKMGPASKKKIWNSSRGERTKRKNNFTVKGKKRQKKLRTNMEKQKTLLRVPVKTEKALLVGEGLRNKCRAEKIDVER